MQMLDDIFVALRSEHKGQIDARDLLSVLSIASSSRRENRLSSFGAMFFSDETYFSPFSKYVPWAPFGRPNL
jgi:hypothetical protein